MDKLLFEKLPKLEKLSKEDYVLPVIAATALGVTAKYVYGLYANGSKDSENKNGFKEIPSPPGCYPYIGHMLTLKISPGEQLKEWHDKLGPVISLKIGAQKWVSISDQNIAHELFVRNGIKSPNRPSHDFGHRVYSKGGRGLIFGTTETSWKSTRAAAQTILSPKYVDTVQAGFVSTVDTVFKLMREDSERIGSVNPKPYFYMTTYSSILKTVFGKSVKSMDDPLLKEISYIVDGMNRLSTPFGALETYLPHFEWVYRFTDIKKQMEEVMEARDKLFTKLLKEAAEGDYDCLAKRLVSMKKEYKLDDKDLVVLAGDLIAAGGETSGTSLSWLVAILCNHPEMQKTIIQEIDSIIEKYNRMPLFSDREKMPFTTAVLRENLRFRSCTNLGLPHHLVEDVEAFGYFIPKGTSLLTSMHAMHMNPDIYDEPEKFKPERFLGIEKTWSAAANGAIKDRDMYAFGWGRRICPGMYFAEMEIFNMCVRMFSQCTIEHPYGPNGEKIPVDMDSIYSCGVIAAPLEYEVRMVSRPDCPAKVILNQF
ncbi:cytochrome P450 [Phycomyces nitens]|nr:cytochrome P450 [Phycomyces nitens]